MSRVPSIETSSRFLAPKKKKNELIDLDYHKMPGDTPQTRLEYIREKIANIKKQAFVESRVLI